MNRIQYILVLLMFSMLTFTSCDGLLDANTPRLTSEEDYRLSTSSDSIYSMFGLLTQLQKLGDSYVLLGELRADLMTTSENSDKYLKEIENLEISKENPYVQTKNYYAVINNCNYIIAHLDTNVYDMGQKLRLREYAAVKSIRAWTYMQLALNFKTVKYYTKPILTVDDALKTYPELEFNALADSLIADLEPVKNAKSPVLGYIESYNTSYSMIPARFVLGDLYLWKGEYAKAAFEYHKLIFDNSLIIHRNNISAWVSVNNTISSTAELYWQRSLFLNSGEVLTTIACPSDYGQRFLLDTLNNQHMITPSDLSIQNWDKETYYLNEASSSQGDLRKFGSISYSDETNRAAVTNYAFSGVKSTDYLIYKYKIYDQNITICRSALLYLRYAEAVNRMNKPNLAFAILKNGLNSQTMFEDAIVPPSEKVVPLPEYMNFADSRFLNNVGTRMRGSGFSNNNADFVIPEQADMLDSVRYVENLILQENALEMAYEGNRYHDLMRFTLRRMNDGEKADNTTYFADKIANKNNDPAIRTKLTDINNWYIH